MSGMFEGRVFDFVKSSNKLYHRSEDVVCWPWKIITNYHKKLKVLDMTTKMAWLIFEKIKSELKKRDFVKVWEIFCFGLKWHSIKETCWLTEGNRKWSVMVWNPFRPAWAVAFVSGYENLGSKVPPALLIRIYQLHLRRSPSAGDNQPGRDVSWGGRCFSAQLIECSWLSVFLLCVWVKCAMKVCLFFVWNGSDGWIGLFSYLLRKSHHYLFLFWFKFLIVDHFDYILTITFQNPRGHFGLNVFLSWVLVFVIFQNYDFCFVVFLFV